MRYFPLRELGYAIGFIVVLALLYGGAYFALMQRSDLALLWLPSIDDSRTSIDQSPVVHYRFGEEWSEQFFAPAHEVDRLLRPDLWRNEDTEGSRRFRRMVAAFERSAVSKP